MQRIPYEESERTVSSALIVWLYSDCFKSLQCDSTFSLSHICSYNELEKLISQDHWHQCL